MVTVAGRAGHIRAGKARIWNRLLNVVFATVGKPLNIEYIDMPESIRNQYQYFTQADISKVRKPSYKAKITSLESAIRDYVQNHPVPKEYILVT